jgi:hypothetical protein
MRNVALVLAMLASVTAASGGDKGKGKGKGNSGTVAVPVSLDVVFSDSDRVVIREWVRVQPANGLPPGLQKGLPPGLQKQLQRNGRLPPGLQKKITPFPSVLVQRLPPPPPGCDYIFLDGRALIVARATQSILDVVSLF